MFKIDVGTPAYPRHSYDGEIDYQRNPTAAERKHRQIINAIWATDSADEVDDILEAETEIIDALEKAFPEYFQAIDDAACDVKSLLR